LISFVSSDSHSTDIVTWSCQIIIFNSEQSFISSSEALLWIWHLSASEQYSLLKELNTILKHQQMNILDIQSNIVDHIIKKKLWHSYIDEWIFHMTWKRHSKNLQHWTQQDKICIVVDIIRQYWEVNVWNKYFKNR
jgi:hypothetical protein